MVTSPFFLSGKTSSKGKFKRSWTFWRYILNSFDGWLITMKCSDHNNKLKPECCFAEPKKRGWDEEERAWTGAWVDWGWWRRYRNHHHLTAGLFHVSFWKEREIECCGYDRHKWEAEEEIMFDTEEEAIIAQNIIEEVLGSVWRWRWWCWYLWYCKGESWAMIWEKGTRSSTILSWKRLMGSQRR